MGKNLNNDPSDAKHGKVIYRHRNVSYAFRYYLWKPMPEHSDKKTAHDGN